MIFHITKEEFSKSVEEYVKNKNYCYIDAVDQVLTDHSMDHSIVKKLLTRPIIAKLEEEFTDKNFIRGKKNKLPFS